MIVVTGASRGLGKAICNRLHSKNIDILGLARNTENLDFPTQTCDISSFKSIKDIARNLKSKKVTGLINVAGISSMNLAILTPEKTVQKIIQTNLIGTIYCCQQFAPLMIRNKEGVIINFSTVAVPLKLKGESIYIASKAGIEGFTSVFAREMSEFNIRVNCISPGPINTDLLKGITEKQINGILSRQVIQKQFSPEDVSDLVEIILDKRSSSISGQTFYIGGI